ncbi:hypothetical protein ACF9IK_00140 [Kitasatospora hibisci]
MFSTVLRGRRSSLYTHVSPDYRARTVRAALDRIAAPRKETP